MWVPWKAPPTERRHVRLNPAFSASGRPHPPPRGDPAYLADHPSSACSAGGPTLPAPRTPVHLGASLGVELQELTSEAGAAENPGRPSSMLLLSCKGALGSPPSSPLPPASLHS